MHVMCISSCCRRWKLRQKAKDRHSCVAEPEDKHQLWGMQTGVHELHTGSLRVPTEQTDEYADIGDPYERKPVLGGCVIWICTVNSDTHHTTLAADPDIAIFSILYQQLSHICFCCFSLHWTYLLHLFTLDDLWFALVDYVAPVVLLWHPKIEE